MILTKHILDQVSYWTRVMERDQYDCPTCVFALHFKQWWKPSKTLRMPWLYVDQSYVRSQGSHELERQLKTLP